MRLCIRDNAFDFSAYEALRTRVTYSEMQEIADVLCVEGDNRYTFQMWLPDYLQRADKPGVGKPVQDMFAALSGERTIDVELVRRELATVVASIESTNSTLANHRLAVATGGDGLDLRVVDALDSQLAGLKNSKVTLESQLGAVRDDD